jgi:hypothetical protein
MTSLAMTSPLLLGQRGPAQDRGAFLLIFFVISLPSRLSRSIAANG